LPTIVVSPDKGTKNGENEWVIFFKILKNSWACEATHIVNETGAVFGMEGGHYFGELSRPAGIATLPENLP
jgi:hypothetical protein